MNLSTSPQPTSPPINFTLAADLAKDSLIACLLDHNGEEIKPPTEFDRTPAGLRKLVAWLIDPTRTRVVFEFTGVYGKRLIHALDGVVASLHQLNPKIVKRRLSSSIQTKTDQADARKLIHLVYVVLKSKQPSSPTPHPLTFDEQSLR